MRAWRVLLFGVSVLLSGVATATGATAVAAPGTPPNDDRADASSLGSLPQTVRGTTAGATTESNEILVAGPLRQ